jgi:hypothetical protein
MLLALIEIKGLDNTSSDHTVRILTLLCETACRVWESSGTISIESLKAFFPARAKLNPMPVAPDVTKTRNAASERLRNMIDEESFLNQEVVEEWKDLKVLLMFHLPEFFDDPHIRQNYKDDFAMLMAAINEELTSELDVFGRGAVTKQADRVTSLAQSLSAFELDEVIGSPDVEPVILDLERIADDFKKRISTSEDETEDYDVTEDQDEDDGFNVNEFFADL